MKLKATLTKVIALLILSIGPISANAVSFDSSWFATRSNGGGTTTVIMPPHAVHFCYLSRVGVNDTDSSNEWATCRVRRSGTVWILEAILSSSDDADVFCEATCYNN